MRVHLGGRTGAVEAPQQPALLVVADQRLGLGVIDAEPVADGLFAVVVALLQLGAVDVAALRVLGRVCRKEAHVYHVDFDPPKHADRCDTDGSELDQRGDDAEPTVRNRLGVYHEQTEPLIAYYEERGLLRRFDGTRTPADVHDHIRATLATLRLEEQL